MDERVYAVLYKVHVLDRTKGLFYYQPCHIVCGLYDNVNNEFIDEAVNEIRYNLDDKRTIIEYMDYAIGKCYTKKELIKHCGGKDNFDEALINLYDESLQKEIFCIFDYYSESLFITSSETFDELLCQTDVTKEKYINLSECEYVHIKKDQIDNILNMDKVQDVKNYIEYIKTYDEEYALESIDKETPNLIMSTNDIDEFLEEDDLTEFKEMLSDYIAIKKDVSEEKYEEKEVISSVEDKVVEVTNKLNKLIGLDNVKKMISLLISDLAFKKKTQEYLVFEDLNKHMIFTGAPGTGKTTVAQTIAPFLYELGYLRSDKIAFVAAQDLIGEYIGQTAPKTEKLIKKNNGGIIFLDEAYILAANGKDGFGNEALTVILKEMEKSDGTMFIFAGYEKEMNEFIKMNSGFRSRIGTYLNFKDYSEEELYQIFDKTVTDTTKDDKQKYKLKLTDEAINKVKQIIHTAHNNKDFGNARFIKNLFSEIRKYHSKNTIGTEDIDRLYLITKEDIPDDILDTMFFSIGDKEDSLYRDSQMGFKVLKKK